MARHLHTRISDSLDAALRARAAQTGASVDHLVQAALAEAFGVEQHSIFQVSTSGALVEGVYQGCVSVADLLRHGDFGLGTFDSLDGEMIVLDGVCYQARSDGTVRQAPAPERTPFAVVTAFTADRSARVAGAASLDALLAELDGLRDSDNSFVAIRAHGIMARIDLRAACRTHPGVGLVEATAHQAEHSLAQEPGTLVGFWTPPYAGAIGVPGYHLHFISDDRKRGGHVLDLSALALDIAVHHVKDLHLAIPETAQFLRAALGGDTADALRVAEGPRR